MTTFGPHVSYSDPRIHGLVAGYGWGPHQREMLLGTRPWTQTQNAASIVACLRERGIVVGRDGTGVGRIHMDGLPPGDAMLPTLLAQWGIAIPRVSVLSLFGPVETVGGVPLFRATVFGRTERSDGVRRDGLHHDAWIVGRQDVRRTYRLDPPWDWPCEWSQVGGQVARWGGVRGMERRALNTARDVAAALPDWEEFCAWSARRDAQAAEAAEAAEAARRAAEVLAVDEEDVVGAVL